MNIAIISALVAAILFAIIGAFVGMMMKNNQVKKENAEKETDIPPKGRHNIRIISRE